MESAQPPDQAPDFGIASDAEPQAAAPAPTFVPEAAAPPIPEGSGYPDRGTGLMVFGVLQIILGLLSALMVPLAAFGAFMSSFAPGGSMRPTQFLSGVASYAFIAVGLIALGIGSIQMKRWARALTLVTSWYSLITGVLLTVLLTAMLPVIMRTALVQTQQNTPGGPSPAVSTGVMAVILTVVIIFAAFFLVLMPIAFIVFYSRKDVLETVRRRDPVERWTDKTPLPVLGTSVVFAVGALYLFLMGVTNPLFPFFGQYLTGIAGSACFLALAALDGYLAIALFRLQSAAWWIATLTLFIRLFSMVLTYARTNLMQAYSQMGMSDTQLKMLNSNPMFRGNILLWWSLISLVLLFGYLLWLKRYFKRPAHAQTNALPAQVG